MSLVCSVALLLRVVSRARASLTFSGLVFLVDSHRGLVAAAAWRILLLGEVIVLCDEVYDLGDVTVGVHTSWTRVHRTPPRHLAADTFAHHPHVKAATNDVWSAAS